MIEVSQLSVRQTLRIMLVMMLLALILVGMGVGYIYIGKERARLQAVDSLSRIDLLASQIEHNLHIQDGSFQSVLIHSRQGSGEEYYRYLSEYYAQERALRANLSVLRQQVPTQALMTIIDQIVDAHESFGRAQRRALWSFNRAEKAMHEAAGAQIRDQHQALFEDLDKLKEALRVYHDDMQAGIDRDVRQLEWTGLLVLVVIGLAFFVAFSRFFDMHISRPVAAAVDVARNLAMQEVVARDQDARLLDFGDLLNTVLRSGERVKQVLDAANEGVFSIDRSGICTYANVAAARLCGYDHPSELIGQETHHLIHHSYEDGEPYPVEACRIAKVQRTGEEAYSRDEVFWRPDGSSFAVEYWSYPILQDGAIVGSSVHFRDITEQMAAEQALRTEQFLNQSVLESAGALIVVLDSQGRIQRFNRACEEVTLYDSKEVVGRHVWDVFILPEEVDQVRAVFSTLERDGLPGQHVNYWRTKDHGRRLIEWSNSVLRDSSGRTGYVVAVGNDITEKRLMEEAYIRQKAEFEAMFKAMPGSVVFVNVKRQIVMINPAFQRLFGYEIGELRGKTTALLYEHEDDYRRLDEEQFHVDMESVPEPYQVRYRRKDDRVFCGETRATKVVGPDGEILGYLKIVHDISERIRTETDLVRSEDALEKAQAIAHFGSWVWDIPSGELDWSDEIYRIFGLDPEQVAPTYDAFLHCVHPDDRQGVMDAVNTAVADPARNYDIVHRLIQSDGKERIVHERGGVYRDDDGQPLRMIGTVIDITERARVEAELEKYRFDLEELVQERTATLRKEIEERERAEQQAIDARKEAEHANVLKSEFISRISHELRTPMNAVLGFGQLLEIEDLTELQRSYVKEVMQASNHLLGLIDEVLDLSQIEAGKLSLQIEDVLLGDIMHACVSMVLPLAERHQVTVMDDMAQAQHVWLKVDYVRCKQVLLNLLSNAVKYNKPGGRITLSYMPVAEDRGRIEVTDTGIGIAVEKQPLVFEPFGRLGAEYTEIEGTGVGLTIAKQLTELMDGEIGLVSEEGRGSTFWVEFPLGKVGEERGQSDAVAQIQELQVPEQARLVLYVEDNPANQRLVGYVIQQQRGIKLETVPNAELGIEIARSQHPDLILLDINLPGMDGYEALAQLRAHEETRDIPVVAISAAALARDVERGLKAGFRSYLTKPVQVDELMAVLKTELHLENIG